MSKLAKRYANAIFELIENESSKAKAGVASEFLEVSTLYKSNQELREVFNNPILKPSVKKEILQEIMEKSSFKDITKRSLNFILNENRFSYIPDITTELLKNINNSLDQIDVTIILAREMKKGFLSDPLSDIKKKIESEFSGKKFVYNTEIDPSIIGGVIVKIGDKLYDFSVKTSLESIKMAIN